MKNTHFLTLKNHPVPPVTGLAVALSSFALATLFVSTAGAQTYFSTTTSGTFLATSISGSATITTGSGSLTRYELADDSVLIFDGVAFGVNRKAFQVDYGTLFIGPAASATGSTGRVIFEGFSTNNSNGGVINYAGSNDSGTFTITNALFRNNSADSSTALRAGGAINFDAVIATFNNVDFESNYAGYGGAIRIFGPASGNALSVWNNSTFADNYALGSYASAATANSGEGGAIWVGRNRLTTTFNNSSFIRNRARTHGGAISYFMTRHVYLNDTTFTDNWAGGFGGAIYARYLQPNDVFQIHSINSNLFFSGNVAAGTESQLVPSGGNLLVALAGGNRPFDGVAWAGGFLYAEVIPTAAPHIAIDFNTDAGTSITIGSPVAANRAWDSIANAPLSSSVGLDVTRSFQKSGSGTLVLNADNSYVTGTWSVNAGSLLLGNSEAQLGSSLLTVAAGATFGGQGSVRTRYRSGDADVEITGTLRAGANSIMQVGNGKPSDTLTIASDFIVLGNGVTYNYDLFENNQSTLLELDNFNVGSFTGTINVNALATGTFTLAKWNTAVGSVGSYFGSGANVVVTSNRASASLSVAGGSQLQLTVEMFNSSSLVWTGGDGNTWRPGGAQKNWLGATALGAVTDFQNHDFVYFDGIADAAKPENRSIVIADSGIHVAGMVVGGAADYAFEGGAITSTGTLVKTGATTLSLHNTENNFAQIQLREGTLSVASAAAIGGRLDAIAAGFASGGDVALIFDNNTTLDGVSQHINISGNGNKAAIGAAGGSTLTVQNATGGDVITNAGQLTLTNVAFVNNAGAALTNTGTLEYAITTAGTTTSAGNTTFLNQAAAGSETTVHVASDATLVVGGDADTNKDALIISNGALEKTGAGTWLLKSHNQNFNALLNVREGSFLLGGAGASISGTVNVIGATSGGEGTYDKLAITNGTLLVGGGGQAGVTGGQILNVSDLALADALLRFGLYYGAPVAADRLNLDSLSSVTGANGVDVSDLLQGSYVIATGNTGDMEKLAAMGVTINGEDLSGPRQIIALEAQSGTLTLVISSGPSYDITWNVPSAGIWNTTGTDWLITNTSTAVPCAGWDRVRFADAATGIIAMASTAYVSDMIVEGSGNHTFTGTYGITASDGRQTGNLFDGTGKLYKHGSGTLAFQSAGANLFQGGIDWHDGTIIIQRGDQIDTGTNAINIIGHGVLEVESNTVVEISAPIVFAGPASSLGIETNTTLNINSFISGNGSLTLGGVIALTGSNTYSGATTLMAGAELSISRDASLGAADAPLVLAGDATLRVSGSFATIRAFSLGSYNLALNVEQNGELTLERHGAGQFAGTGMVTLSGALHVKSENALGSTVNWTIASGGRLDLSASQAVGSLVNRGVIAFRPPVAGYKTLAAGSLAGSGTITMNVNLQNNSSDRLVILGDVEGSHYLDIHREGGAPPRPQDLDIILVDYAVAGSGGRFNAPGISIGIDAYVLQDDPDSKTVRLVSNGLSNMGDAILATAGVIGLDWHYSLDSLHKRMGEFRAGVLTRNDGNFWMRGNFYRLEAAPGLIGDAFYQDSYDITAGVDKGFTSGDSTLYAGVFAATAQSHRNFENHGEGNSVGIGGGIYLAWLHETGWYADLTARYDDYDNKLTALFGITLAHASFNNHAVGGSLEIGKRLVSSSKIWLEPSIQAALVSIAGTTYQTDNQIDVEAENSTYRQYRFQLRAGADLGLWMPYVKIAMLREETRGGRIRTANRHYAANYSGNRFEAGCGVCWNVGKGSQAFIDYEYNKANHYRRPWAFNIGYRHNW